MERTCPSCSERIDNIGEYFCLKCGFRLPSELVTLDVKSSSLRIIAPNFEVRDEINSASVSGAKRFILPLVLLVLITTGLGYIYYYYTSNLNKIKVSTTTVNLKEERVITQSDLGLEKANFTSTDLMVMVPDGADLFVQGKGLFKFLSEFVDMRTLESFLDSKVNFNDLDAITSGDFAIFSKLESTQSARAWGVVTKYKDKPLAQKLVDSTKEATWSATFVNDYLLFSNNRMLEKEARDAKKKIALNLSLNPKFALARNSALAEGKLLVVLLSEDAKKQLKELDQVFLNLKFEELRAKIVAKDKSSIVVN